MANLPNSPAFTPPTPSTEPENVIETFGQSKETQWGARMSIQPKGIQNDFPVRHIPNGQ